MLPKPPSCRGCPFYGDGQGFVPDELHDSAPLLVMAQNPGEDEEKGRVVVGWSGKDPNYEPHAPAPLIGRTGYMARSYYPLTGFQRGELSLGNVIRCRWRGSNDLPTPKLTESAIEHCYHAHFRMPSGTKLILAMGNPAKWAMTGKGTTHSGMEEWRGWLAPWRPPFLEGYQVDREVWTPGPRDLPVLMTLHLADLFGDPLMKVPARADWAKAARVLSGRWPGRLPPWRTMGEPAMWQAGSAFDTEFDPLTGALKMYQLCTPDRRLFVIRGEHHDDTFIPPHPVKLVMQNAPADLANARRLGLTLDDPDDTMLAHSVLWAGMPHDLNFLGSLYASINRWKHLFDKNLDEYAAGDAWGTLDVWEHLERELANDPASQHVYETYVKPLSMVIAFRSGQGRGLRVLPDRARKVAVKLKAEMDELSLRAGAVTGYPLSLASPAQVAYNLYTLHGLPKPRGRRR